jgi:Leucine-rich repeat (LRR) protein
MLQPLISDYKQAVLDATNSFKELLPIEAVQINGEPKFATGNFAVVFQMRKTDSNKLMAVKCFHRHLSDRQVRQQHIAAYLEKNKPKYFVPYRYLPEELWIDTGNHAQEYAVVAMDWVEGKTLGETVKNHCKAQNKEALSQLADKFCEMAAYLLTLPIAHGDLKHDNILVTPAGELVLVDYDGMYVPALQGHEAAELGGTDYQHPQRKGTDYNATIDDYSIAIIALSLAVLAQQPELYELQKGENLLLSRQDILNPFASEILPKIEDIDNKTVQKLLNLVKNAVMGQSIEMKGLKEFLEKILVDNCPLTMEWWDGLLQYGNLEKKGLEQYTWQDIFLVHLAFLERGIILNDSVMALKAYEGNCFEIYKQEFKTNYDKKVSKLTKEQLNIIFELNDLYLYRCDVDTLKPLQELKNLQVLNCGVNKINSLEPLRELKNLQRLVCPFNQISSLEPLRELNNLQTLAYPWNEISSLEDLQELKNLEILDCRHNQITDLEPLRELNNLQTLNCSSNQIRNLGALYELKKLQELSCSGNEISNLGALYELKNLKKLDCSYNKIITLSALLFLKNLEILDCSKNKNHNIDSLQNLQNLQILNCSSNQIRSLEPLRELQNLKELLCWDNQISRLEIQKFKEEHPNCRVLA